MTDGMIPLVFVMMGARSTWTERGRDIPSLPYGRTSSDRGRIHGWHANGLSQLQRHKNATIPMETIRGDVMLVCGDLDRV